MQDEKTPIVILAFNRPDMVRRLLERIRLWEPQSLWIVVDGPRNEPERARVDAVKALVEQIDWCSNVQKNYAERNMGCRGRVSSGLDWFFEHNERGIILEDDCVPLDTFFPFCEEMLARYENEKRVAAIEGCHRLNKNPDVEESYFFSTYFTFHGWATWRRAWNEYSNNISDAEDVINRKFAGWRPRVYWKHIFELVQEGRRDSWGYRWMLSNWRKNALAIYSKTSLVQNIGYGKDSTHTRGMSYKLMPTEEMEFPLIHPAEVQANSELDAKLEDCCYSRSALQRILWVARRFLGLNL